jgi:hypothetical protein
LQTKISRGPNENPPTYTKPQQRGAEMFASQLGILP